MLEALTPEADARVKEKCERALKGLPEKRELFMRITSEYLKLGREMIENSGKRDFIIRTYCLVE